MYFLCSDFSLHGCVRLDFCSDQLGAALLLCFSENVHRRKDGSFWETGSHPRLSPPVSSLSYCGSCSLAGGRDLFVLEEG